MVFVTGDTFFNNAISANVPLCHLWMVISDPDQGADEIVIVNFTTWKSGKDNTCVLDQGDHPFIQHKTYVNYKVAQITTLSRLEKAERQGLITCSQPLDGSLLEKIRQGAIDSPFTPVRIPEILTKQGLV